MDQPLRDAGVPFTRADAWILAALIMSGGLATISRLIADADHLNRATLTYDEVSFGVPRVVAGSLVETSADPDGRVTLTATPRARSMVEPGPAFGVMSALAESLGCRPYPDEEVDDRSLGRLPGLDPADLDAAVTENGAWRSRVPSHVWAAFEKVAAEQRAANGPTIAEKRPQKRGRDAPG